CLSSFACRRLKLAISAAVGRCVRWSLRRNTLIFSPFDGLSVLAGSFFPAPEVVARTTTTTDMNIIAASVRLMRLGTSMRDPPFSSWKYDAVHSACGQRAAGGPQGILI